MQKRVPVPTGRHIALNLIVSHDVYKLRIPVPAKVWSQILLIFKFIQKDMPVSDVLFENLVAIKARANR
jgi:hypothetical protein